MREAGIPLRPTLVAFTPWTTLDDYRAMLDFVDAKDLIDAWTRSSTRSGSSCRRARSWPPPGHALTSGSWSSALLLCVEPSRPPDGRAPGRCGAGRPGGGAAHADDAATFERVRALAAARAAARRDGCVAPPPGSARPPRLTEPWFC